jgi:hypothetical protein
MIIYGKNHEKISPFPVTRLVIIYGAVSQRACPAYRGLEVTL